MVSQFAYIRFFSVVQQFAGVSNVVSEFVYTSVFVCVHERMDVRCNPMGRAEFSAVQQLTVACSEFAMFGVLFAYMNA